MGQIKNTKKVERKYNNKENQIAKVNQTWIISLTFIESVLILELLAQTFAYETSFGKLGIIPVIVLFVGIILNWCCYLKNKKSFKLKYYMVATFLIGWVYLMVLGTSVLVSFYIYPLVVGIILYHDRKFEKILFCSVIITTIIRAIVWAISGQLLSGDSVSFISIVLHLEIVIVIHIISKLSEEFSVDMIGAVQDERKSQAVMLHEVLDISKNVQETVLDTNELIENLKNDSSMVHHSIEDISGRTQNNVESVQEQSEMTQQINTAIEDTAANAKVMVEAADKSSKLLEKNVTVMASIKNDAEDINKTNNRVAESMEELQKKAK